MHETNFINGIRLESFKGNVGELLSIGTDGVICISASIQSITGGLNIRITNLETSTSGITGGLTQLDTRYTSNGNYVHLSGNETISGNKTFVNSIIMSSGAISGGATITSPKGTGASNEGFGSGALESNTIGLNNTALGYQSLQKNTSGNQNTALGYQALQKNTIGYNNIALGYLPLAKNIDGFDNIGIGYATLYNNTIGDKNTALGSLAGYTLASGDANTALGFQALQTCSTGSNNVAIGQNAGYNELGSNKFYIDSTSLTTGTSATALIYGDFVTGKVYIKGQQILTSDDDSMYTLLTTTQAISASLDSRITTINNNYATKATPISGTYNTVVVNSQGIVTSGGNVSYITSSSLDPYTLLTTTQSISGNLQNQITAISGSLTLSGRTACDAINSTFNITHSTINTSTKFPIVTMDLVDASSDLYIVGVYGRASNSFNVVLSSVAPSGCGIMWHLV